MFEDMLVSKEANDTAADFIKRKIRSIVKDPKAAAILSDNDHPYSTERPPIDTDYFETYNRPNVSLVDVKPAGTALWVALLSLSYIHPNLPRRASRAHFGAAHALSNDNGPQDGPRRRRPWLTRSSSSPFAKSRGACCHSCS
jgi:hypothetical protein